MSHPALRLVALLAAALLVACGGTPPPAASPATRVDVVTAEVTDLPLTQDLVGRLAPTRVAEVRARVAGVVLERVYVEGSDVKAGDLLFRIDPAPLEATRNARAAARTQAQTDFRNAERVATRYRELASRGVIAKQDLDDAVAKADSARAALAQAQANLASAELDLGYARVTAPIDGRAGRALVTEGALVGQGAATELTRIEQIDPIYVNFSQSMQAVQRLRAELAAGRVARAEDRVPVALRLADGTAYAHQGSLDFADMAVDPATGAVSLRAVVPNPERVLLPGMFVDVTLDEGVLRKVVLVPQAAVQRDAEGAFVHVVVDGKAERRNIDARNMQSGQWVVTAGLAQGDVVIVTGLQALRPGATLETAPWPNPATAASTSAR